MLIAAVTSTQLFVGEPTSPRQVVQVEMDCPAGELRIDVTGEGVQGQTTISYAEPGRYVVDVGVTCAAPAETVLPIRVSAEAGGEQATAEGQFVVAETGWTVWMVSHFHYDPVWWNTQAAYTATWDNPGQLGGEFRADFQRTGFDLVRLHLETARRDPDYKFVLAELDYLKPYWDTYPQDRAYLRSLLAEGRLELMGGTYNEPNTNLTSAESTIRNLVYGAGFQRDVLGGDPRTAWQLDAFGHDPQFPGLVADAGLDSSSWARGPFHQWGPMLQTHAPGEKGWGDPTVMQFSSEFEWLSPSGRGVLTHYMPAHYSAGWQIDSQPTLAGAEQSVYTLFQALQKVAATRNVLLPVGTDYTPPAKWITEIQRDWNSRYLWPRLVCGLPSEFFAAVRAQLDQDARRVTPQTRDMNPIYTGKDVSFIDTKQAQRHTEALLVDAEIFATIAAAHGDAFPHAAMDKAWRHLVYGAHHDAITGSESDQVYLDLLTSWREAYDLAGAVRGRALARLSPAGDGPQRRIVVFNPSAWTRADLVRVRAEFAEPGTRGVTVSSAGGEVPVLLEHPVRHAEDGSLAAVDVVFRAEDVPSIGYRTWQLTGTAEPTPDDGWREAAGGSSIENDAYRLAVDPARGGGVSSLLDRRTGRELLQPGRIGNEILVYDEYPAHPRFHEGPWHLLPKSAATFASAQLPADAVRVEHSSLGQRITVTGAMGPLRYTQRLTLWEGVDRLDAATDVDDFAGADHLVRLRWPAAVPGALPVSEVGNAVVGRGFGLIDVDSDVAPWTLDNPAHNWFALSSTARVEVQDPVGNRLHTRAIGVAEIILGDHDVDPARAQSARDLAVALVRQGVTATTSTAAGTRYGRLAVDSNLPDVRIAVGGPATNAFTAAVLAETDPAYAAEFDRQVAAGGGARLWVPATKALTEVWVPGADLTGTQTLPVLIVAGAEQVSALCAELDGGAVSVRQPADLSGAISDPDLDDYTVALVNRGIPGFAVDTTGALHLSVLRSCTGWPSGVWIDPPRRTAPDGSNFQQQHWAHTFEYSVIGGAGDWRANRLVGHGHEVNHPLIASVIAGGPEQARSYVTVESDGQLVLAALKPAGNPIAGGRLPGSTVDEVLIRLYEATGQPATARLRLWAPASDAQAVNVLEQPLDGAAPTNSLDLAGSAIGQYHLRLETPAQESAITEVEPFQPVYSRYWLNNTGTAPMGNLPVSVTLDPPHAPAPGPVTLSVTVASALTADRAAGEVTIVVPDGWRSTPPTLRYDLEPGGHLVGQVVVTPADPAGDGVYWILAQIRHGAQTVQDVARLLIGTDAPETLDARVPADPIRLRPGQTASIEVGLGTDAATAISVQAQLISPWHTWDLLSDVNTGASVPARGRTTINFPVRVPPGHAPGRWWALVKLAHAGQLHYTQPIELEVLP
jgi:alpha-mannosidase